MKLKEKGQKTTVTMNELISYPKDSLGFHLGNYLFSNSTEPNPVPEKEDIYRTLITNENSEREHIAVHYYLFGNGNLQLQTLLVMVTGLVFYPLSLSYFYSRYRKGKKALRFHDVNHFKMLHLPLERIKDTFLIR